MTFQRPSPILYLNFKKKKQTTKLMSNWFSFATWQPAHYYVILGRRPCFFRGGFNSSVVSIAIYYILQCRKTDESLCCMLFHNGPCPTQKRRAHPVVIISFLCCYCWTCFTCAYWWWRNRPSSSLPRLRPWHHLLACLLSLKHTQKTTSILLFVMVRM